MDFFTVKWVWSTLLHAHLITDSQPRLLWERVQLHSVDEDRLFYFPATHNLKFQGGVGTSAVLERRERDERGERGEGGGRDEARYVNRRWGGREGRGKAR